MKRFMVPCDYMPSIYLRVFFDMKKAAKHMAKVHGNVPPMREGMQADTNMDGSGRVIIRFRDADKMKERDLYALMAHESVHAAKEWLNIMGEDNPGEEQFAYMVQCVYICVFNAWQKHLKRNSSHLK